MAGNSKDSKILEYKDMINQLNKTIAAQTELIQSLPKTLEEYRLEKEKPILDAFWNWLEQQRPKQGDSFGESGELCPKSERHSDDLSGRWSL